MSNGTSFSPFFPAMLKLFGLHFQLQALRKPVKISILRLKYQIFDRTYFFLLPATTSPKFSMVLMVVSGISSL